MNLLAELRNDLEGAKLLSDWIGEGKPVAKELAESRAQVCVAGDNGKPCPLNKAPRWWDMHANFKNTIAEAMRAELELKNRMMLRLPVEDSLHICAACGCCLPLALWAPIERLAEHTTKEHLAKMPDWCWKKREVLGHLQHADKR